MMRPTAIHHPKSAGRGLIRRLGHDLVDQLIEGNNTGRGYQQSENPGAKDIPGSMISDGAQAVILELNLGQMTGTGQGSEMTTSQDLDGLLIGREEVFRRP